MNLEPRNKDLATVTKGDTFPGINLTATGTTEDLSSVKMEVWLEGATSAALTLSSGSGITINTATAGAWDFTIDEINPVTLAAGWYSYDLDTTDAAGTVRTRLKGTWNILPELAD